MPATPTSSARGSATASMVDMVATCKQHTGESVLQQSLQSQDQDGSVTQSSLESPDTQKERKIAQLEQQIAQKREQMRVTEQAKREQAGLAAHLQDDMQEGADDNSNIAGENPLGLSTAAADGPQFLEGKEVRVDVHTDNQTLQILQTLQTFDVPPPSIAYHADGESMAMPSLDGDLFLDGNEAPCAGDSNDADDAVAVYADESASLHSPADTTNTNLETSAPATSTDAAADTVLNTGTGTRAIRDAIQDAHAHTSVGADNMAENDESTSLLGNEGRISQSQGSSSSIVDATNPDTVVDITIPLGNRTVQDSAGVEDSVSVAPNQSNPASVALGDVQDVQDAPDLRDVQDAVQQDGAAAAVGMKRTPAVIPVSGASEPNKKLRGKITTSTITQEDDENGWRLFRRIARRNGLDFSNNFDDDTTHVIMNCSDSESTLHANAPTMKFYQAIARGLWVLSHTWMEECVQKRTIVEEVDFEVQGVMDESEQFDAPGPTRSRETHTNGEELLFHGVKFYLVEEGMTSFTYTTPRTQLEQLVCEAGGQLISRSDVRDDESTFVVVPVDCTGDLHPSNGITLEEGFITESIEKYQIHDYNDYIAGGNEDSNEDSAEPEAGDGDGNVIGNGNAEPREPDTVYSANDGYASDDNPSDNDMFA